MLLGQRPSLAGQHFGRDVVGGAVVQPPGEVGTLADDDATVRRALQSGDV